MYASWLLRILKIKKIISTISFQTVQLGTGLQFMFPGYCKSISTISFQTV